MLSLLVEAIKAVIKNSGIEMLVKLASTSGYTPIYHAPVAVVVSTDRAADPSTQGMANANAACAGENMLLAATKLSLGSCYLGSPILTFHDPAVCAAVRLPKNMQP